ncbi:TIGR02646 family protein [Beggiatoa alba B18LD]|uniref:TIGR02646 family protein n=1 Tax=Beggiatoa alba B18LD TaxID=395493 RepID=I3CE93_9GAMM|nr:retron system putative HNH endonuclease [Beggiatoa alba]EIJ41936.1 TIGR02646 family protein [Beggiatoa alba B18LD]
MIKIVKHIEPNSLIQHRCQDNATYNDLSKEAKDELRHQLLIEQGYLCAYCMQRIEKENSKIEHWHCQSRYPKEQLDYKNMLAVCQGNEGQDEKQQHCDTKKGNTDITCHPADSASQYLLETLKYLGDGRIQSTESELNKQIETILNLNISRLMDNRKNIVIAVKKVLNSKKGSRTQSEIQQYLNRWKSRDVGGKYQAYCGVAIDYLEKKLKRF